MAKKKERWLAIGLRVGLVGLFAWMLRDVAVPVALGALYATIAAPWQRRLAARLGRHAAHAPLVITSGSTVLVVLPALFVTAEVMQVVTVFVTRDWGATIDAAVGFLDRGVEVGGLSLRLRGTQLQALLPEVARRVASAAGAFLGGLATALPAVVLDVFLFVASLYYFLRDGEALLEFLARLSPFSREQTHELFASVREAVQGAVLGMVVSAAVQGGLTTLALYALGVPNAALLGILATCLSVLPLLGTTPVTLGAAIYLFAAGRPGAGVAMLVLAVVVGSSDNLVRPWVQSAQSHVHPLLVLLGIFGGLSMFGPSGVFLGPIVAAMAVWTIDTYARLRAADRERVSNASGPTSGPASGPVSGPASA